MAEPLPLVSVPIPEDLRLILLAAIGEQRLVGWSTEALVVEAVRERILSRRKAASLLGFDDFASRESFFIRHGLVDEYTMEMLEEDFKTIGRAKS